MLFPIVVLGLSGCGEGTNKNSISPITLAYREMDKGHNAKAVEILKPYVEAEPHNAEARLLISSAYLGVAEVDIYKIYDTFSDLIFDRSLLLGLARPETQSSHEGLSLNPSLYDLKDKPPIQFIVDHLDFYLMKLSQIVTFLNRFPYVEQANWNLLDSAIENLKFVPASKDICLYRIFIGVVYIRSFIGEGIIGNDKVGSQTWLCNINLENLQSSLNWISRTLDESRDDLALIDSSVASRLNEFNDIIATFQEQIKTAERVDHQISENSENYSAMFHNQVKFRSLLNCPES